MILTALLLLLALVGVGWLVQDIRIAMRTPPPELPPEAMPIQRYLAADVTAGLPHEEMVRAAIVEYMADESSDVEARIAKLESELDFYVLGKGEGVPDAYPEMKQYGMTGPPDPYPDAKPVCKCANPVVIEIMGRNECYCGLCNGEPPRARWYPGVVEPCYVCEGTGLYTIEEPTCPHCKGTGTEPPARPRPLDTGQPETR